MLNVRNFGKDEECLRPGEPTDSTFLEKMSKNLGRHPHFLSHSTAKADQRKTIDRTVRISCFTKIVIV